MKDVMLFIVVLAVFAFGFCIVKCVDDFLDKNYKNMYIDAEKSEPSCVMLTDNISEEEIIKEIREFREKHGSVEIYLCDNDSDLDMSEQFTDE